MIPYNSEDPEKWVATSVHRAQSCAQNSLCGNEAELRPEDRLLTEPC